MDDSGLVWLGSSSGDVMAVALAVLKQPHGGLSKRIEVSLTPSPKHTFSSHPCLISCPTIAMSAPQTFID